MQRYNALKHLTRWTSD